MVLSLRGADQLQGSVQKQQQQVAIHCCKKEYIHRFDDIHTYKYKNIKYTNWYYLVFTVIKRYYGTCSHLANYLEHKIIHIIPLAQICLPSLGAQRSIMTFTAKSKNAEPGSSLDLQQLDHSQKVRSAVSNQSLR